MAVFWKYFRGKLRFSLIWSPGPLAALAKGGAAMLDEARDAVLWLRDQFIPERCEQDYIGRFADSRGIVRGLLETDAYYNARVRLAYQWWVQGGRTVQMEMVLKTYFAFGGVQVQSLRDEDENRWAEFRVLVDVIGENLQVTPEQVVWAINETKPARSLLAEVIYSFTAEGAVPVWAIGMASAEIVTVYPQ